MPPETSTSPVIDNVENMNLKVAIVGAGASGLQCANLLINQYGFDPSDLVILEGRDRIGGRILTTQEKRVHDSNGQEIEFSMDHGAAWVHGTGVDWAVDLQTAQSKPMPNPMMQLLEQTTLPGESVYDKHLQLVFHGNPWMRPQSIVHKDKHMAVYVAGQRLAADSPLISVALQRHFALFQQVSEYGDDMFERGLGIDTVKQSLQEAIKNVLEKPESRQELQEFSNDENELVEALTPFYQHLIECWYGQSATQLQLCEFTLDFEDDFNDKEYTEEGDFYGPHCTLRHGMKTVLEPLFLDGVSDRIRLNEEVTHVSNDITGVVIETSSGRTVHADSCVVTIPVGCLEKAIQTKLFEPELSQEKQESIRHFKMGSYKKVFLTFDHIFWPTDEAWLGLVRKLSHQHESFGNYLLCDNLWARDGIPCIEALLFGSAGTWAVNKSDEIIRDAVLEFMKEAMGLAEDIRNYCKGCHVTRWEEDRFSRGAYSHMCLGALRRHNEELRRPEWEGRLIFAGEATISEFEGSVHAALFSGMNSAAKVDAYCRGKKVAPEYSGSGMASPVNFKVAHHTND